MEFIESIKRYDQKLMWDKIFGFVIQDSTFSAKDFSIKEALKPINLQYNRYNDVVPYDHSRVILDRHDINDRNDYINASFITLPQGSKKYIATQNPLTSTVSHFWQMVWQENANIIVMLNRLNERTDTALYWPEIPNYTMTSGQFSLRLMREKRFKTFSRKELLLTYNLEAKKNRQGSFRTIIHYQYFDWPDFGVPETPRDFVNFVIKIQDDYNSIDSADTGPILVHCSAGIGRTGTFILADACLDQIGREKDCVGMNPAKTLLELRLCRNSLVQTSEQLRFAYRSIAHAIETLFPDLLDKNKCCEKRRLKVSYNPTSIGGKDKKDVLEKEPNGNNNFKESNNDKSSISSYYSNSESCSTASSEDYMKIISPEFKPNNSRGIF